MSRKQKKYFIQAAILIAVFIAAVNVFGYFINRGNDDMTADMGAATYPQISFSYNGYSVNQVPGYSQEMDIASMRDTITPVANSRVEIVINEYGSTVESLQCKIFTMDGKEALIEKKVEEPGENVTIDLQDTSVLSEERVLQIVAKLPKDKMVYYYTRLIDAEGKYVQECLDYMKDFHENALDKREGVGVGKALEPDERGDNGTLQHVTIHSDYDHVTWGELKPVAEGGEMWLIKEINATSTSAQLQYQVRCKGEENEDDVYKVKEFFRVRYNRAGREGLLLDYDRTMEQVFDATRTVIGAKGVILGIADTDTSYIESKDGTKVAFVQADELWLYDKKKGNLSLLFSFASAENTDERNKTAQHRIQPLEMDKAGNLTFAVYGYMNRGAHEGDVGVLVYHYDMEQNSVKERVFLATKKSYGHAIQELGKMVYYSEKRNVLYALIDGTLYELDIKDGQSKEVVSGLKDGQYVVSEDRKWMAYEILNEEKEASQNEIKVMNLSAGDARTIESDEGETVKPLGFMSNDFVYGVSRGADEGETVSGETVKPMYKVEIESSKGKSIKTYEQSGIFVLDTEFEGNMITLDRATKEGKVYHSIIEDYITNNEEKKESDISLETYTTRLKQRQVRIAFKGGIEDKTVKILKPKQILLEKLRTYSFDNVQKNDNYFVYGYGELQGIYEKAGDAVRQADLYNGVVVSADQKYIWERGNRDLEYRIDSEVPVLKTMKEQLQKGVAPFDVTAGLHDGVSLDLTGCTPEELMYIINQERPVVAMLDGKRAIILVGYTESAIAYMDIETGERKNISLEKLEEMTQESGNTYIA